MVDVKINPIFPFPHTSSEGRGFGKTPKTRMAVTSIRKLQPLSLSTS